MNYQQVNKKCWRCGEGHFDLMLGSNYQWCCDTCGCIAHLKISDNKPTSEKTSIGTTMTEYIYVCDNPLHTADIIKRPITYVPPHLAVTGISFEQCRQGLKALTEIRIQRLKERLKCAEENLANITNLTERTVE